MTELAVLGGTPAFAETIPIARPSPPDLDRVVELLRPSYERGVLTEGPLVARLEEEAAARLDVQHVVAVSSCTSGLLLALQALGLDGDVVLPSFTFAATAHAVMWNGLRPRFAECDDAAFQLDVQDAATRIDGAAALIATHVFGVPAPAEDVEKLARSAGIPVLFDAAHCLGALRRGRPIGGFGDAEVFSLSPTKPVVAGEGGLVSTNDDALAAAIRLGRGYGNPGDYNTRFAGLNARMSELHAAVALESLREIDEQLARRRAMADTYRSLLGGIPGVQFQAVDAGDLPTYKDFTIAITPEFGVTRDELVIALRREGVDTRCYFSPPVHRHQAYAHLPPTNLPVTDAVAGRVVSLPFFFSLSDSVISRIAEIVSAVQTNAERVAQAVRAASS